jgi:hypothetical protein
MNDTEIQLLTLLNSYGDIIELDWDFDPAQCIAQLESLSWMPSTNGKHGLNLTGTLDDLGLDSTNKHDADQEYNSNLLACPSIKPFFDRWEKLARCRAVKLNAGSFFKMHRDAHKMRPQMRIFIPLNKTQVHEWNFIYNTELFHFKPGRAYIINTRKQHGSFAMSDDIYHVLMSVYLTTENIKTVMNMLPNCKEY